MGNNAEYWTKRFEELEKAQLRDEKHALQIKEFEKKLEDQKKLVEEMQRKAAEDGQDDLPQTRDDKRGDGS